MIWLLTGVNVAGVALGGPRASRHDRAQAAPAASWWAWAGCSSFDAAAFAMPPATRRPLAPTHGGGDVDAVGVSRPRVRDDSRGQRPRSGAHDPASHDHRHRADRSRLHRLHRRRDEPRAAGRAGVVDGAIRRRRAPARRGAAAARLVALGAAVSCFGALNGWILVAGQLPMAVARTGSFRRSFGRVSSRGTPALAHDHRRRDRRRCWWR